MIQSHNKHNEMHKNFMLHITHFFRIFSKCEAINKIYKINIIKISNIDAVEHNKNIKNILHYKTHFVIFISSKEVNLIKIERGETMKTSQDLTKMLKCRGIPMRKPKQTPPALVIISLIILLSALLFIVSTANASQDINLDIIAQIESSNCKYTVGDNGRALGCYQLHAPVILDYNRAHGTKYLHSIAHDKKIASTIANWYLNTEIPRLLRHYHIKDTTNARLVAYNAGINAAIHNRTPKTTLAYIAKYNRLTAKNRK